MILRQHYTDEGFFETEVSRLLSSRFFFGTQRDFPESDCYYSFLLGERHALTCRRGVESVRAFSNVCLHRKCLIDPEGYGSGRFRCGYHGWQYDSSGELCRTPRFELEKIKHRKLEEYGTAEAAGLLFLAQDKAPEVSEVGGLMTRLGLIFSAPPFYTGEIEHHCNWKLLAENVLDREHLSQVHGASFVPAGIDSATPVDVGGAEYTLWNLVQPEPSPAARGLQYFKGASHQYLHGYVFPNLFLANTNNLVGFVSHLIPVRADRTLLRWQLYELPALLALPAAVRDRVRQDAAGFAEKVLREDKEIVERCQKGMLAARIEPQLQESETQVLAFQQMWARHFSRNSSGKG